MYAPSSSMHTETHADSVHNSVLRGCVWTSQVALAVKNPPAGRGDAGDADSIPWVGKTPWRRAWQPTPVFLPGESHAQRSLAGCSPRGHKSQT